MLEEGQQKGGGLTGARLGLTKDIAPAESFGDESSLDGSGLLITGSIKGRE
jgi:hypothetical protein